MKWQTEAFMGIGGHTMFARRQYTEAGGTADTAVEIGTASSLADAVSAAEAQESARAGQTGAAIQVLRECLESNYQRLLRRLSRRIGCSDTASDSLHEAWVRLGSATLPDAVHSAETYVFRMAYNLAVDQMRGRRMWESLGDEHEAFDGLPDRGPGPEAVAGARSELAALSRALGEMSGHHRRVLMELRVDDLTREEVAARHGLSLRKVDTLLRQTLDYCAMQTGRMPSGGIGESRRPAKRISTPVAAAVPVTDPVDCAPVATAVKPQSPCSLTDA